MSAFLARLAARAVGQVPVAQPRVPSLFEAASPHAVEVTDDEVAVGPQSATARSTAPTSAVSPTDNAMSTTVASAASSRTPAQAIRDPAMQGMEPVRSGQRQDAAARPGPRPPRTVVSDQVAPEDGPGALPSDPAPVPRTSLFVPAGPLSTATPVASHSVNEVIRTSSAPEPPAVRVHIGRLEIRANLPEAAPVRPPARQVREESSSVLSLADYLRGAR
jgi:hypothetical protein